MKLIHRFAYYSLGLVVGIIFLLFFLSGKKTSCAYGLDARVKKNIRIKERQISPAAQLQFSNLQIDTSSISILLKTGDVDFNKSNTKLDSCKLYFISGMYNENKIAMEFENCDSTATVQKVIVVD